ncbi:MAG: hypothetical protein P1P93_09315 [Gammaproteobacteria bacterium]|nr:hypothetical protein [Gammaproteobacteria bacterium]
MTVSKTILSPESFPHVELDFMNTTHFEEIELVKKIGDYISAYQQSEEERDDITLLLDLWFSHTRAHFAVENELMLAINFPAYSIHLHEHEHDHALTTMAGIVEAWKRDHDLAPLEQYVFSFWPQWFHNHVNTMDVITAQFARMHGVEPHAAAH